MSALITRLLTDLDLGAPRRTSSATESVVFFRAAISVTESPALLRPASDRFKAGDIHIIGTRYSKTSTSTTNTISLNSRYPVTSKFRINPRFRVDFRKNKSDDSEQTTYRPFLRLSYKLKRGFRAEADAGGEWSNRNLTDTTDKDRSWFVNAGYRMDF